MPPGTFFIPIWASHPLWALVKLRRNFPRILWLLGGDPHGLDGCEGPVLTCSAKLADEREAFRAESSMPPPPRSTSWPRLSLPNSLCPCVACLEPRLLCVCVCVCSCVHLAFHVQVLKGSRELCFDPRPLLVLTQGVVQRWS